MRQSRPIRRALAVGAALSAGLVLVAPANALTSIQPYAVALDPAYETVPLLSSGDLVSHASGDGMYRMVGIPDGLGAMPNGDGTYTVFMNHELTSPTISSPNGDGPDNRGALVSKWVIDEDGNVLSGERAYDHVFQDNQPLGPAAEVGNSTPAFSRFCSASLAGEDEGLDRPIYFTNEEDDSEASFDGRGGQSVVVSDGKAYALSRLGHFSKENDLVQPRQDELTVILSLEDGPTTPDSQLYMYVGHKAGTGNVLTANGLNNGELFVFVPDDSDIETENDFTSGSVEGTWVEVKKAKNLDGEQLEAASDALGALGFVRIEDGAFSKVNADHFYFVTTGDASSTENDLGRLYHLELDPGDPTGPATLNVVYDADTVIAAGGDTAISPDNIDTSKNYLMIQEDGTGASRPVMAAKGRDGQIWRFSFTGGVNVDPLSATPVVTLDPPGRDGVAVGPGVWETSGIISAPFLGEDVWLFDVQAHSPTAAPSGGTVEDGQLLLLRPTDD
jgi:hypothetical protein